MHFKFSLNNVNELPLVLNVPSAIITQEYNYILNTKHLVFDQNVHLVRTEDYASKQDDRILPSRLANDGFISRYGKQNKVAYERLQKELRIIDEMGFKAYFLINWDIVRYA